MNSKDIRAEAEKRLTELEAECAELRKMLGKDPPVVPYPAPVFVPYIQPYPCGPIGPSPLPWPYDGIICTGQTLGGTTITVGTSLPTTTATITGLKVNDPGVFTTTLDGAAAAELMAKHGLTFNVNGAPGGSGAWS